MGKDDFIFIRLAHVVGKSIIKLLISVRYLWGKWAACHGMRGEDKLDSQQL